MHWCWCCTWWNCIGLVWRLDGTRFLLGVQSPEGLYLFGQIWLQSRQVASTGQDAEEYWKAGKSGTRYTSIFYLLFSQDNTGYRIIIITSNTRACGLQPLRRVSSCHGWVPWPNDMAGCHDWLGAIWGLCWPNCFIPGMACSYNATGFIAKPPWSVAWAKSLMARRHSLDFAHALIEEL